MTSKKPAQEKRASPPRNSDRTKQFRKDWERLTHSGRYLRDGGYIVFTRTGTHAGLFE